MAEITEAQIEEGIDAADHVWGELVSVHLNQEHVCDIGNIGPTDIWEKEDSEYRGSADMAFLFNQNGTAFWFGWNIPGQRVEITKEQINQGLDVAMKKHWPGYPTIHLNKRFVYPCSVPAWVHLLKSNKSECPAIYDILFKFEDSYFGWNIPAEQTGPEKAAEMYGAGSTLTTSGKFLCEDGHQFEIPPPGDGWMRAGREVFDWPAVYVETVFDDGFFATEDYTINHKEGLVLLAEYSTRMCQTPVQCLEVTHWTRPAPDDDEWLDECGKRTKERVRRLAQKLRTKRINSTWPERRPRRVILEGSCHSLK